MKRKLKWNPYIFASNMAVLCGILTLIWFAVSIIQVWMHQMDFFNYGTHFEYPSWNIFIFFNNLFGGAK